MATRLALVIQGVSIAWGLDNGAARVPPMGWLSWERFACKVDCDVDPSNCISAQLYKDMADRMAADGWKEAGYEYVNVDDCWSESSRDDAGLIHADEKRFPGGIKALCDYVHSKGLKCGLYTDIGPTTCAGYPALNVTDDINNTQFLLNVELFASWGIDSLKVDGCNQAISVMPVSYPRLSGALVDAGMQQGHPILYSCSWPAYISIPGDKISKDVYDSLMKYCNIWRNWADISDSWDSVKSIIKWWHDNQDAMMNAAGPGHFNDPDMILAGNTGLSQSEYEVQFSLWSIFAAPLLMSNDLRKISSSVKSLLQNPDIIAINQDEMGIQGKCVFGDVPNGQSVWMRPLSGGNTAVALLNGATGVPSTPANITVSFNSLGLSAERLLVYDLLKRQNVGEYTGEYTAKVPTNSVHFVRLSPVKMNELLV